MTWGTPVQSFVFLGLLVFELQPMYATSDRRTDRQTDRKTDGRTTDADHRIMPPRRGHNNDVSCSIVATLYIVGLPKHNYQRAKCQLPSSISFGDMERGREIKMEGCRSPRHLFANKNLHRALVPMYTCQRTKHQLSSSIGFGDMERAQNKT